MTLLDQFDGETPDSIPTGTEPMTCIHCGADALNADPIGSGWAGRYSEVYCAECGTSWTELYRIVEIVQIKIGKLETSGTSPTS